MYYPIHYQWVFDSRRHAGPWDVHNNATKGPVINYGEEGLQQVKFYYDIPYKKKGGGGVATVTTSWKRRGGRKVLPYLDHESGAQNVSDRDFPIL